VHEALLSTCSLSCSRSLAQVFEGIKFTARGYPPETIRSDRIVGSHVEGDLVVVEVDLGQVRTFHTDIFTRP